ncbi:MAG: C69 family dipeptidase, partial [bacterium]|nr:C69 family dipeptidase [bacterium]
APNTPIGHIPQVARCYTYYEGTYPIMNEKQLSIGETTCPSKVTPKPDGSKRLFYSAELMRVAMERCDNALAAVRLVGALIDQYGYYGTGECLVIADTNEIWVMEMTGYAADGTGGLWVAKRVPDDAVFVSANLFRIRVVETNSADMLYSANLFAVCEQLGWWHPSDGPLDWLTAVTTGESGHPYACIRRVWRIFSLVAPSTNLSPTVAGWQTTAYPFAMKPDQKLSVQDVFALHRDRYQGTDFDLTKGLAAQAAGDPVRFDIQNGVKVNGAFERSISFFRSNYINVNQARGWLPNAAGGLMWIGFNEADRNCFMPVHVGVKRMPQLLERGDYLHCTMQCAWWVFQLVCDTISRRYDLAMPDVRAQQAALENSSLAMVQELDAQARAGRASRGLLTRFADQRARAVTAAWKELWAALQVKFLKNFMVDAQGTTAKLGYPAFWLENCGYTNGPIRYATDDTQAPATNCWPDFDP